MAKRGPALKPAAGRMTLIGRIKLAFRVLWHGETPPGPKELDMQHGRREQSGWPMALPKSFFILHNGWRGIGVELPNGEFWVMFPHGGGLHRTKRELFEIVGE